MSGLLRNVSFKGAKNKLLVILGVSLLFCIICLFVSLLSLKNDNYFELYFLDVAHGDAIVLNYDDFASLIDGGPSSNINNYLSKLFYPLCNISAVLLTHPHEDHMGGLDIVSERCGVGMFLKTSMSVDNRSYKNLIENFESKSKMYNLEAGDYLKVGNLYIYVIWPTKGSMEAHNLSVNNLSIALLIDYFDFEAVLLSDVEREAQGNIDISEYLPLIQGKVDVMKFPHQGSKDALNAEFFNKINPESVVLSVGKNSYGHPSKETMDFLRSKDVVIYRTDENGTIKFKYVR